MPLEAAKFRGATAFEGVSLSLSSKNWDGIADSFETAENIMEGLGLTGDLKSLKGNPKDLRLAIAGHTAAYIAKQGKEYARGKAEEARKKEQEFEAVKERVLKAQWERAMRDISERSEGIRERVFSKESLRNYRDPPTRESLERTRGTA